METNNQGLIKEEKVMFILLGIILLVSIGVLIINAFNNKDTNLDNNDTPIKETSGQKDNIKDDNNNEPVDILIEEETEDVEINYQPVVNIPSSTGSNIKDQSISKPKPQPVVLDWTFKDTMVTEAFSGDVITIEKNVLLTNGKEEQANIVILKQELDSWITVEIIEDTFTVSTGLYKYIYSYGSSTKELLLTVNNKISIDTISILKLNELVDESTIAIEEYTKYQTLISNTELDINNLTINNYVDTNNLLPLVITFNKDITNKIISTNTLGITITNEQQDWYETLTPNSIIMWLDLNTIDTTNNLINLDINGVTYTLELNITINKEETTNPDQGELDNDQESTEDNLDDNNQDNENDEDNNNQDEELIEDNNTEEDEEEELDPLEPQEDELEENSSSETPSSEEEPTEDNNLQTEINDISIETS